MTVADSIRAEIARLEAELAALPTEVHTLEQEVWEKIKSYFIITNPTQIPPAE